MAAKRLIKELDQYNKDPSPAVVRLEPTSEDDIFHLTAVLRGPEGTAYEGKASSNNKDKHFYKPTTDSQKLRRSLPPAPLPPTLLPQHPSHHNLQNTLLPPEHLLHHGRNLPRLAKNFLDSRVRGCNSSGSCSAVAKCGRGERGQPAEFGCREVGEGGRSGWG